MEITNDISKLSFKNVKYDDWMDYDCLWEDSFESSGYKKIFYIIKNINMKFYRRELNDTISPLEMHNDMFLNEVSSLKESNIKFKFTKYSYGESKDCEGFIEFDYDTDKIKVESCISDIGDVVEYLLSKYSEKEFIEADKEDFIILKNLMPLGMMDKHQFSNLDEFLECAERLYSKVFDPTCLIYHIENIKLSDDESKCLYLQAPKIMEDKFGYDMSKNKIWDYFRSKPNYMEYMRALLSNMMKNDNFVLILLECNEDYKVEVCRILNTLNGTRVSCIYNTNWLFDRIGIEI